MTNIQEDAIKLHAEVAAHEYYTPLYKHSLVAHAMTPEGIVAGEYTDRQIVDMANTFWTVLPDTATIRRGPFFLLCNIAENWFDDEPDDTNA